MRVPRAERLRSLVSILRQPRRPDTVAHLARSWALLPAHLQAPQQMLGRQGNGCGATVGAMPRCDFSCQGCYLGESANGTPALPLEAVKAQLDRLRAYLGHAGDLQLTDGEITLRPEPELVELIRYASDLGLVPMVMSHGDGFRLRPRLLERLMRAGLREVSFHVDTTMRGRSGEAYRRAERESQLDPLRHELAERIRVARASTGRPLQGATTLTITPGNLRDVPGVLRTLLRAADAFKIVSFQPAAQVGRTRPGVGGGVDPGALWEQIAAGLERPPQEVERAQMWLGHSDCSRFVHGFVLHRRGRPPRFHPLWRRHDPHDEALVSGYLARFGGVSFRRDDSSERAARALALLLRAPGLWLGAARRYAWARLGEMAPRGRLELLGALATGRARIHHFIIASHHFMDRAELSTPRGQERLHHCVFRVPVGERMVSMCEVNAIGVRERLYREQRSAAAPPGARRIPSAAVARA